MIYFWFYYHKIYTGASFNWLRGDANYPEAKYLPLFETAIQLIVVSWPFMNYWSCLSLRFSRTIYPPTEYIK